jgi:predicted ATPase
MDPQIRRQRTLEAIKRLLLRETRNHPLLIVIEDLHWVDNETQAFLASLAESIAGARLLLLVSYRPEYAHPWGTKTYFSQLRLDPLEEESAEEMLGVMLGNEASLRPLKKVILEKSEGVPFFIEEIVQALFDRGVLVRNGGVSLTRPITEIHVPPTVQGMLAARIDRLQAEEKELLQTAAVAGREFSLALLERVTNRPADGLQRTLARLQAAEFVYEQPASTELDYVFKHALTQEVAYASVLLERRRQLHDRIAQAIESLAGTDSTNTIASSHTTTAAAATLRRPSTTFSSPASRQPSAERMPRRSLISPRRSSCSALCRRAETIPIKSSHYSSPSDQR